MSKNTSLNLYGMAILFMVFHHMFDTIALWGQKNGFYYSFWGYNMAIKSIAIFCKICVAMYAFISGYGIACKYQLKSESKQYKLCDILKFSAKSIIKLFVKYWAVLAIFLMPAFAIGAFDFSPTVLLKNITAISTSYNWPAWYIKQYILIMIITPIFIYGWNKIGIKNGTNLLVLLMVLTIGLWILFDVNIVQKVVNNSYFVYTFIFFEGLCCKYNEWYSKLNLNKRSYFILLIFIILTRSLVVKKVDDIFMDCIIIIPFCICVGNLFNNKILQMLGCQTAHCGRGKSHFIFVGLASPIVPYRNLKQTTDGITADCRSLV